MYKGTFLLNDTSKDHIPTSKDWEPLRVTSLGWGVQSFTIAAMSALGHLPKFDFVINADTTWERQATYDFALRWTPWLEERGIPVIHVWDEASHAVAGQKLIEEDESTFIPAFTLKNDNPNQRGQLNRQCTQRWKIAPIRRFVREAIRSTWFDMGDKMCSALTLMDLDPRIYGSPVIFDEMSFYDIVAHIEETRGINLAAYPGCVQQSLGISSDEWQRAKTSDVKYIDHVYPLLDLGMTRQDCINFLESNGLEVPGKSSCMFCPYRSRQSWVDLKRNGGPDWQTALEVDERIRNERPGYTCYVHPGRKPLNQAIVIPEDFGLTQSSLFDDTSEDVTCDSGYCFM